MFWMLTAVQNGMTELFRDLGLMKNARIEHAEQKYKVGINSWITIHMRAGWSDINERHRTVKTVSYSRSSIISPAWYPSPSKTSYDNATPSRGEPKGCRRRHVCSTSLKIYNTESNADDQPLLRKRAKTGSRGAGGANTITCASFRKRPIFSFINGRIKTEPVLGLARGSLRNN